MADNFETEQRDASTARVPNVRRGQAIVYTRYHAEKSVVLHPEDFRRLVELDEALNHVANDPPALSDLARKAHEVEDTPGEPVEDPGEIERLLGL